MNVLVIATHHGAFLTIQHLKQRKVKNVTVVIPQSQIDKYKTFPGKVFAQYEQNMKKFCGKKIGLYVSEDWNPRKKMESAFDFISAIGGGGTWLVLEAGSILGDKLSVPETTTFGVVRSRVHPKFAKLYKMLGKGEEDKSVFSGCFFVNMEDRSRRVTMLDSDTFHRPDVLYAQSFGMLWCIRYQQMVTDTVAMCFWMEAIRSKQESGEWVAYPYDRYKDLAEKVQKYLPSPTFDNIVANGAKTQWLADLVALDL